MIRFILRRRRHCAYDGMDLTDFETIDFDVPELEAAMAKGGFGESGYDRTELVGAEVITPNAPSGQGVVG